MIGVMVSTFAVGGTLILMNKGLAQYNPVDIPVNVQQLPVGVAVETQQYTYNGKSYVLLNAIGSSQIPDGKYLYDPGSRKLTCSGCRESAAKLLRPRKHA